MPKPSVRIRCWAITSSAMLTGVNFPWLSTLWGVAETAPYFHDNGAKTLRDAVAHYQRFFNFTETQDPVGSRSLGGFITLTDDVVDDIVAYLKLLGPSRTGK